MNNIAITVDRVIKNYKLYSRPIDRLKESLDPRKKIYHSKFVALQDISFEIRKGEIVGIVGSNGSGKSTILKIITGLLNPSSGHIKVNGKISALLELGAGFNMEMTGMQNIYLNGTMMGFSKEEMDLKVNDIIQFADIGEFINQPVKTYSSGMFARLAFAVSVNVEPDILIVDEALAVGDMYFQEKCYEKMKYLVAEGATVLFVSHSLPAVRNFCTKAIWIEKGQLRDQGKADEICEQYKIYMDNKDKENPVIQDINRKKILNKIYLESINMNKKIFVTGEDILINLSIRFKSTNLKYGVGLIIYNDKGEIVTLFNTIRDDIYLDYNVEEFMLKIESNDFLAGKYFISVNISDEKIMYPYDNNDYVEKFEIMSSKNKYGIPISEGHFRAKHSWVYNIEKEGVENED
ncbi:ABC transporter ATP-binding protein [Paenibacillus gallinarum]|uniref:ABC transporter ATP-binding protein n=1 Tax=Paenibacillus gallinarum TaxID=2762232 RepID=A0ABR8SZI0_9BACL|nr:ABC transporter ATP-binding protein [Paenibacillus gallinarum]MBD7968901.1 ABC transporter ATP-binding protein [Paenibacillus gallinarum]